MADRASLDEARRETGRPARPPRRRVTTLVVLFGLVAAAAAAAALSASHPSEESALSDSADGLGQVDLPYLASTQWDARVGTWPEEVDTRTPRRFADDPYSETPPQVVQDAWSVVVLSRRDPGRYELLGPTGSVDVFDLAGVPETTAAARLFRYEREFVLPGTAKVDVSGVPPRWQSYIERSTSREAVAIGHAPGYVVEVTVRPPSPGEPSLTADEMVRGLLELVAVIEQRGIAGFADDTEP